MDHFKSKGNFAAYVFVQQRRFFVPARIIWSAMGFPKEVLAPLAKEKLGRLLLAGLGNAVQPPLALAALMDIQQVFCPAVRPEHLTALLYNAVMASRGPAR